MKTRAICQSSSSPLQACGLEVTSTTTNTTKKNPDPRQSCWPSSGSVGNEERRRRGQEYLISVVHCSAAGLQEDSEATFGLGLMKQINLVKQDGRAEKHTQLIKERGQRRRRRNKVKKAVSWIRWSSPKSRSRKAKEEAPLGGSSSRKREEQRWRCRWTG